MVPVALGRARVPKLEQRVGRLVLRALARGLGLGRGRGAREAPVRHRSHAAETRQALFEARTSDVLKLGLRQFHTE